MDMSPNRECRASQKTLMRETGLSKSSVIRHLKKLAQLKLISTQKRWKMTRYYIGEELLIIDLSDTKVPVDKIKESVQKVVSGVTETLDQVSERHLTREGERKTQKKLKDIVQSATEHVRFDEFYSAYPRKQKRDKALKAWIDGNLDNKADQILAHIELAKQNDWWDQEMKYIPLPASYLNDERWTDEILWRKTHEAHKRLNPRAESVNSYFEYLKRTTEDDSIH
jgi:DNA-binding transcriptional regulator GbsR (MarR family)